MLASDDLTDTEVMSGESAAKHNGQVNSANKHEFAPSGDFPLESKDEVVGILKKRSRSPETGDTSNKKSACVNGSPKLGAGEDYVPEGIESDPPVANLDVCQTNGDNKEPHEQPKFTNRWKGDVYTSSSCPTFQEAQDHESQLNLTRESTAIHINDRGDQMKEAASALTSFALSSVSISTSISSGSTATSNEGEETPFLLARDPAIELVPRDNDTLMLSDYNNLLVRHIEFFYPARSHLNYDNLSGSKNSTNMSDSRLGLRCVHCKMNPTHVTAAAFFPSAINSIASGLGTIGSRHFGWGKCPNADTELVHQMIETKKQSSLQTRTNGRIGLDAYCKNLANHYGIFDDEVSGICWIEGKIGNPSLAIDRSVSEVDRSSVASVLAGMRHDTNIEPRPYVPSEMNCFWECSKCRAVPIQFRSKGSVIFSVEEPTAEMIEDHVKICNGIQALLVPRTATIEPFYGDYEDTSLPRIRVKWENNPSNAVTSSKRRSEGESTIKSGVDEDPLCFEEDKRYTTDFAFFTVKQLKRCYLTKAGGSRGTCPIGYAGLACGHCAGGSTERRFFYTSADHLRNSFSHIPSHLKECSSCPDQVKARLEELKAVRNRQKSQLKVGHHKIFIDRVWNRLHDGLPAAYDKNSDDISASQRTNAFSTATFSRNGPSETIKAPPSALIHDADRVLTSDLAFFTLLQVAPYKMLGGSHSDESDSREIGFPGLICSHCNNTPNGRKFFTTSAVHLSGLLVTISNHMQTCQWCPKSVRNQILRLKSTHESQLQLVSAEDNARCMQRVWERLVKASQSKEKKSRKVYQPVEGDANVRYLPVDQSKPLVTPEDEQLVTPYTSLVMKQVRPCNLGSTDNGSRSQFADGFPGLECIHCADTSNSRKFFYRTVDILSGNYAHIPNHLMGCAKCPTDVKTELAEKKEYHMVTKSRLDRGSQRKFFQNIWERLHAGKQVQT